LILCYHKVALEALTHSWVTADSFDRQLADLQAYDVVSLDEYDPTNPDHVVITFDGPYSNVATFALPLLRKWGYPFEAFVIGDWIGRENNFDRHVEPPAGFASLDELDRIVDAGGRVQWHTRTHGRLSGLSPDQLDHELSPPFELRERYGAPHLHWFAYPNGEQDAGVVEAVRQRFTGGVAGREGDILGRYSLPRREATEYTTFSRSTVSVVIANHNYGRYLPEAVDSVLRQSRQPDQMIIIDDCSTDGSQETVERYRGVAEIVLNDTNLGIVPTFRKAVEHTTGDYVVILGADNRMRSDFVERCKARLDADPDVAIAYTDMVLFGPRAGMLAQQVGALPTVSPDIYLWEFPEADLDAMASLEERNFMHGSSMYRRADYDRVGGYASSSGPEDHHLFRRMLAEGASRAARVAGPLLEYRQHSGEQANTLLIAQREVAYWMGRARELEELLAQAGARATELEQVVATERGEAEAARQRAAALEVEIGQVEARVDALARSAELLALIEAGGWWRLRSRLLPLLSRIARARGFFAKGRTRG
jgi:peptidoglycan/xylan/chitin deacetylase (PgdA/CDA1 family)